MGIFLFAITSRMALGPTQRSILWVTGALSSGGKRLGSQGEHSPPSSAEVKNAWSYTSTPQHVLVARYLVKQRENLP
jgi:hypothetical protein